MSILSLYCFVTAVQIQCPSLLYILCCLIAFPPHPHPYLLQTPVNSNFCWISLDGLSYWESTVLPAEVAALYSVVWLGELFSLIWFQRPEQTLLTSSLFAHFKA